MWSSVSLLYYKSIWCVWCVRVFYQGSERHSFKLIKTSFNNYVQTIFCFVFLSRTKLLEGFMRWFCSTFNLFYVHLFGTFHKWPLWQIRSACRGLVCIKWNGEGCRCDVNWGWRHQTGIKIEWTTAPGGPSLLQNKWSWGNIGFLKKCWLEKRSESLLSFFKMEHAYKSYPWMSANERFTQFFLFFFWYCDICCYCDIISIWSVMIICITGIHSTVIFITFACDTPSIQISSKLLLRPLMLPLNCSIRPPLWNAALSFIPLITHELQRGCQQFQHFPS